jgi:WD40 repeat protein
VRKHLLSAVVCFAALLACAVPLDAQSPEVSAEDLEAFLGMPTRYSEAAYSPDGKWIATLPLTDAVQIWDAESGRGLRTLAGGWPFVFSPDGRHIIACSDNIITIWNVQNGQEIRRTANDEDVYSAAYSPDGSRIVTRDADNAVKIWNAATGAVIRTLGTTNRRSAEVIYTRDGSRVILAGGLERIIKI